MRFHLSLLLATLAVFAIGLTDATYAANLTVNGAQQYQTIGGMGVNLNANSWNGGEFTTALDMLVGPPGTTNGASTVRLASDPMDWVQSEADIALLYNLDPATLARIYETPAMQEIWSTIAYLNAKGLTGKQIILSFMGWTPLWMGGGGQYDIDSRITPGKEPAFATMVASLVYYGRVVKGLNFTGLSPLNESDWDCHEGPCVSPSQFATVMRALVVELDRIGLTDIRFTGPDAASPTQSDSYIAAMMADPLVAARCDQFGLHVYGYAIGPRTSYPGHDYWLTETASNCNGCDNGDSPPQGEWAYASETGNVILGSLALGMSGVLLWEGHDSFWYHHNVITTMGLLAYDPGTGVYTKRKRYYVNSQINGFIPRGSIRVGVSESISGTVLAFVDTTTGTVTIVGNNTSSSPVVISGQLDNLPAAGSIATYVTDSGAKNLLRSADVPVVNGAFVDTIPANCFFSLSSAVDHAPPAIAAVSATPNANGTVTIAWSTDEVSNSRVDYGISPDTLSFAASHPAMVTSHNLVLPGLTPNLGYHYRVTSADPSGNSSTSPNPPDALLTFTPLEPPPNVPPVAVAVALPQSGNAPLLVNFSGAASTDANGDSLTFDWAFGDGGYASGRLATRNYANAGEYTALLTVTDGRGGSDTASVVLSVTTPPAALFPQTAVLDNFNRADGGIGASWIDQPSAFRITGNVLAPGTDDNYIEWNTVFGANQEAFVTLSTIQATGLEHNLMLKTQGTSWSGGHIEVTYGPGTSSVRVITFAPPSAWVTRGTITGVTFAAGDQFGARALADGTVQVFRNGTQIGSVSVSGWAFAALGGRIGVSAGRAGSSRFDNFGGGNHVANLNTPPLASVSSPANNSFFFTGQSIALNGSATDAQSPAGNLTHGWVLDLVFGNGRVQPAFATFNTASASWTGAELDDGTGVRVRAKYVARDPQGLVSDTVRIEIFPEIDLAPAAVTVAPDPPTTGQPVTYSFSLANSGRMPANRSRWVLRAGATVVAQGDTVVPANGNVTLVVNATAPAAGAYALRLRADSLAQVTETSETNNATTRPYTVNAIPANTPPVAVAVGLPPSGAAPLAVNFSGATSSDANGDSLTFAWTFGDGGTATGRVASRTYANAGNYAAILTVSDGRGGTDTASVAIAVSVAPPPVSGFPVTPVLDNFNRVNGSISGSWVDQTYSFRIRYNALAPTSGDHYTEWNGTTFGPSQEVFVTLKTVSTLASKQNLMLKTQGTQWSTGHIEVRYYAAGSQVIVRTFTPPSTWKTVGTISGVTFASGNQFGARALANGTVQVFKNGVQIGSVSVTGWAYAALGGRIGLSSNATSTRFDNFGGGDFVASAAVSADASEGEAIAGAADPMSATPAIGWPTGTLPATLSLSSAFPNPTRGGVRFSLELPNEVDVDMSVHDIQGRTVWSAVRQHFGAGHWTLSWDGTASNGPARTGVYLARIRVGAQLLTRRVAVVQ